MLTYLCHFFGGIMLNFFQSVINREFRNKIIEHFTVLAARNNGTRLGDLLLDINQFLKKYSAKTPAYLGYLYLTSDLEKDAAQLLSKAYLAVVELRDGPVYMTRSEIENINRISLTLINKSPAIAYDFKQFAKHYNHLHVDESQELATHNKIIEIYLKQFQANLPKNRDPFVHEILSILAKHRLIAIDKDGYNFDDLRYMFLYLVLKLDSIINVTQLLDSVVVQGNPDMGQLARMIKELPTQLWPVTLSEALGAAEPIKAMANQLAEKGDCSVLDDITKIFENHEVPENNKRSETLMFSNTNSNSPRQADSNKKRRLLMQPGL